MASESAFSTGGRVIDPHRASLGTNTVEFLTCGADWFRSFYGIKRKGKVNNQILNFLCICQYCINIVNILNVFNIVL